MPLTIGSLLLSSPLLLDSNFYKTVVLITHIDDQGCLGFIVNRYSGIPLSEAVNISCPDNLKSKTLYEGGPVDTQYLYCLHQEPTLGQQEGMIEIKSGLWYDSALSSFQYAIDNPQKSLNARYFKGYSGWGPGQLEREYEEGSWIIKKQWQCSLFMPQSDQLYDTLMGSNTAAHENAITHNQANFN